MVIDKNLTGDMFPSLSFLDQDSNQTLLNAPIAFP